MAYEQVDRINIPNLSPLRECGACVTSRDVCAAGNAALKVLRKAYGDTPSHAITGDRSFWITQADHERLMQEDPKYAALAHTVEIAGRQRGDMTHACEGITSLETPDGEVLSCGYKPTVGILEGQELTRFCNLPAEGREPTLPPSPEEYRNW